MKKLKKAFALLTLLIFTLQHTVFAAEVLVNSGQRQTVVERTKQYAGHVDAVEVRTNATLNFQKNLKVHSGNTTSGAAESCGGYTTSTCGVPCCGKEECKSVCTANMSVAHGNTCLSDYTTSWCGMSCCGKEDCNRVCYNYRTTTASTENCGGYIKTSTGQSCCGLEDCRNKSCGEFTSTVTADFGTEEKCCGKQNCLDVKCDYNHSTEVISGGTAKCCGTKDCYSKYCEDQTSVDSKVDPSKKNLQCCGKENCHQVECDGYTQTNTPTGVQSCCGYEDCRNKECEYRRTATNQKGEKVACCGNLECTKIEMEKTYEAPSTSCIPETERVCVGAYQVCSYSTTGSHCETRCTNYTNRTRYKCCNGLQTVTTTIVPAEDPKKDNCSNKGTLYFYINGSAPHQYTIRECSKGGAYTSNQCIAYHKCVKYEWERARISYSQPQDGNWYDCTNMGGSYTQWECRRKVCTQYSSCTPGSPGCEKTSGWYYSDNPNG